MATSDLQLQTLGSDRFLPVVLGYTPSAQEAATGIDDMLDRYAPEEPSADPPPSP